MDEPRRPSPEALLARLSADTRIADGRQPGQRGQLQVYLGAAPGVGKTWAMLAEGRRLKESGRDVVCGLIETHGRVETAAQIGDLELVPRARLSYRGVVIEEMDTEALLERHPQVCLVDELAHSNAPGSAHAKRWQDVEQLLAAGIDVLSTLNIQHLESLNDIVQSITGIAVRETLPDRILDNPTVVHLIDLPPDALRQRLREGKVYPDARARQALEHYFRAGNLTALRELTLRRMAEGVESSLERYMVEHDIAGPWAATETVLVCVGGQRFSGQVIRHAWRLARGLDAPLVALYVARRPLAVLPEPKRRAVERNLELAEDLGAEALVVDVAADERDLVRAILATARARHVTQIVLGHSTRPRSRWQELRGKSLVTELIHAARGYDVLVVADADKDTS
jgi:two-component system sensor histidine kinase KdpD